MKRILESMLFALALAFAFAATIAVASPTGASTPLQVCAHLNGSATFAPGLSTIARTNTISARATESGCTPVARTGGAGALSSTIRVVKGTCAKFALGGQRLSATGATTWKNGAVSRYSFTFATGTGANVLVARISGRVTAGLFAGHRISGAVRFATVGSPNCTTRPLRTISLVNAKSFVIS